MVTIEVLEVIKGGYKMYIFSLDHRERRHVHIRKNNKTIAKIWLQKNGKKCVEKCYSHIGVRETNKIIAYLNDDKNYTRIIEKINKFFEGAY